MRIKRAVSAVKKRRKIMKQAKGYYGGKSRLYRLAKQQGLRSGYYAYLGRTQKKRGVRKMGVARINAAGRLNDLRYSKIMHGLKLAGIDLNRKVLADIAVSDPRAFSALCDQAKAKLA